MRARITGIVIPICLLFMQAIPGTGQTDTRQTGAGQTATDTWQRPEPSLTRRISNSSAREIRNTFGFSLGVLGLYDSNVYGTLGGKTGETGLGLLPRVYVNFGNRRSVLHLDYQFMYRMYPGLRELDARTHNGGFEYTYKPTRKITFSIADRVRSGANDIFSISGYSLIETQPGDSTQNQQVFTDRQNMFSNSTLGTLAYQSSRKNRASVSAEYLNYRYNSRPDQDTKSLRARANDSYQFSRNWFIEGEAENEWVDSHTDSRHGRIFRALGRLRYKFSKNWEIGGGAGADKVNLRAGNDVAPTYEAFLSRSTRANLLDLRYSRRSGYQLGLEGLNQSDILSASFDQQLGSRTSAHIMTYYYHTPGSAAYGGYNTISGNAGVEFAILRSLLLSFSGNYVYQQHTGSGTAIEEFGGDRYILTVGVFYMYPSSRRQARGGDVLGPIR